MTDHDTLRQVREALESCCTPGHSRQYYDEIKVRQALAALDALLAKAPAMTPEAAPKRKPDIINKAALDQAYAARKKYRANTPITLYSIEGEDTVFIAAYLEAVKASASLCNTIASDFFTGTGEPMPVDRRGETPNTMASGAPVLDSIDKAEWLKEQFGGCYEMFVDPEALYFALNKPTGPASLEKNHLDHIREKLRGAASDCNVTLQPDQVRYITNATLTAAGVAYVK